MQYQANAYSYLYTNCYIKIQLIIATGGVDVHTYVAIWLNIATILYDSNKMYYVHMVVVSLKIQRIDISKLTSYMLL